VAISLRNQRGIENFQTSQAILQQLASIFGVEKNEFFNFANFGGER
jgi:hypothetical protein